MKRRLTDDRIGAIIDQALLYQCACPAQMCKAIMGLRELYDYQQACLDRTPLDAAVHERIAVEAAAAHERLEGALLDVLEMEGWDLETLRMPSGLRERVIRAL